VIPTAAAAGDAAPATIAAAAKAPTATMIPIRRRDI
jgi:hypothetical protein